MAIACGLARNGNKRAVNSDLKVIVRRIQHSRLVHVLFIRHVWLPFYCRMRGVNRLYRKYIMSTTHGGEEVNLSICSTTNRVTQQLLAASHH